MEKAFVWRAAIGAGVVNVLLNPGVAWLERQTLDFMPVADAAAYLALATITVCLLISMLGARRLRHELEHGHRTPHGGTAREKRLLGRLPAVPWQFGLALGVAATLLAGVVLVAARLFGFHGFAFAAFVPFVTFYTGGLAFLTMRWTIVRQLMEATTLVH